MQRFPAKEGTHPGKLHTDTHARLSCLALKGQVGMENELITVIWMYFCVLNVLGHQKLSSSFALRFFSFMLEDGRRNSSHIPLRNILNSSTQQPAGVSRFFSQLFCIADMTSPEDTFPVARQKLGARRGEGARAVERPPGRAAQGVHETEDNEEREEPECENNETRRGCGKAGY